MNKSQIKNIESNALSEDETSSFINVDQESAKLDLGGLFSGEFTNMRPLYQSATGITDLYTATRYGRRFVLKTLKPRYSDDPIASIALAKEFEIGMALDHPNIRRTVGLELVNGLGQTIVLDYCDGLTLAELIKSRTLTADGAQKILEQIADALEYLHSRGVVHRDLKPSNILVSHNGCTVKLIDFSLSDSPDYIVLKNPAGSLKYMAPEQQSPDCGDATPSADIYSFGVVMRELGESVGDRRLIAQGSRLADVDPRRRPSSIGEINLKCVKSGAADRLSVMLGSETLTWTLSAICVALIALIVYLKSVL